MKPSQKPELRLLAIASVVLYCYTYADSTSFLFLVQYTSPALPKATPSWQRRKPAREKQRVNSKRKRRLTAKQERQRIEGLRILARIIARHYLANPHLYRNGATPANGQPTDAGEAVREEGGA